MAIHSLEKTEVANGLIIDGVFKNYLPNHKFDWVILTVNYPNGTSKKFTFEKHKVGNPDNNPHGYFQMHSTVPERVDGFNSEVFRKFFPQENDKINISVQNNNIIIEAKYNLNGFAALIQKQLKKEEKKKQ